MTFEEAWPHIKAGKEFRYRSLSTTWTNWMKAHEGPFRLDFLATLEFEIKREPREFKLGRRLTDGRYEILVDGNRYLDIIKVREVIE